MQRGPQTHCLLPRRRDIVDADIEKQVSRSVRAGANPALVAQHAGCLQGKVRQDQSANENSSVNEIEVHS
jgi:hypothetical protein